jgi:hypothetical protein
MASKLLAVAGETGITTGKFVRFRKSDRAMWSTSGTPAFETYSAGNIANYGIAASEIGATGLYEATDPAEGTAGDWLFIKAATASLAVSDIVSNVYYTGEAADFTSPLVIYVDKANGIDTNDGLTPKTAKSSIAGLVAGTYGGALTVARSAGGKTLIKVAPTGTYEERNVIDLRSTATGNPPIDLDIQGCEIRSLASWNARTGGGTGIVYTAASVTWAAGTATATFNTKALSFYLKTGDSVVITGLSPNGLNGTKTVTISNELQLTYSTSESGSGTGTGTGSFAITLATSQIGPAISLATGCTVTAYNALVYSCPGQGTTTTYGTAGYYANPIGCRAATHTSAKFYAVRGGKYMGDSDGFYDSSQWTPESPDGFEQYAVIEDAAFVAKADAFVVNAQSTHVIGRRLFISTTGPGTVDQFTTESRAAVCAGGGLLDLHDCTILCREATLKNYGCHVQDSNSQLRLYNCKVQTSSTNGGASVMDIHAEDTATVRVHDCEFDFSKTQTEDTATITIVPSHGANAVQISGDSTAADNLEAFTDGTGYAGGTIKLQTDVRQFGGTSGTFSGGRPEVNTTKVGGQDATATGAVDFDDLGSGGGDATAANQTKLINMVASLQRSNG